MLRKKVLRGDTSVIEVLPGMHGIWSFTPIPKVGPALGRWSQENHKFQIIPYATKQVQGHLGDLDPLLQNKENFSFQHPVLNL